MQKIKIKNRKIVKSNKIHQLVWFGSWINIKSNHLIYIWRKQKVMNLKRWFIVSKSLLEFKYYGVNVFLGCYAVSMIFFF